MPEQTQTETTPTPVTFPLRQGVSGTYTKPPATTGDGEVFAQTAQTILREPQELYALWRNLPATPRWQEFVVSVTEKDPTLSHWVLGNPEDADGKRVEFDSRITEDVPGEKLSWKSVSEEVDMSGTVLFSPAPAGRGTRVTLAQSMKVPAGTLGNTAAAVLVRSPRQVVIENLRHFKQLAETGEIPSVKGQPHGPRGVGGSIKEWMYGETNPTPPGTSRETTNAQSNQSREGAQR